MHLPPARVTARFPCCLKAGAVAFATFGFTGMISGQTGGPTNPTVQSLGVTKLDTLLQQRVRRSPVYAEVPPPGSAPVTETKAPEMSLGECIAVAFERQPSLRAVQASQQATRDGLQAIQNIGRVGSIVRPDLPIRKQQACRGVTAAAADVQKIHNEVVYDVTHLYFTVVYAQQQEAVARDVVDQLETVIRIAKEILASPMPGRMNALKLSTMNIGMAEARRMQLLARQGARQAEAALREAMGVTDAAATVRPRDTELPLMTQKLPLTRETVIQEALSRRPELALAAAGVDAFRLEVYAQSKLSLRRTVPTFASGSDIHAHAIPQTIRDKDYRPGGVEPEMPPTLIGTKADRVSRAMWYSQRADAVYDKVRNLVALDAETAFLRFEETAEWVVINKGKFDEGNKLAELTRQNQENIPDKDQLVQNEVVAAKAKSDYIEAVYQHLLSLAALERVTAGAVCPPFPGR